MQFLKDGVQTVDDGTSLAKLNLHLVVQASLRQSSQMLY